ncbi:protein kinase activating protein dpb11 [Coemansia sp. RSA 638]|nr:protein kinase activating protein dpb11 [Coemansia sp. RSA 638]
MFPLLRGCCISCSGLEAGEKDAVHRRIEQLGGSVSFQLTNLVTHVIMKDSLSSNKYRVSAKVGIPVLSVDFLDKCEKEARQQNSVGGDAGDMAATIQNIVEQTWYWPFTGCLVCTTGFDQDIRDEIRYLTAHTTPADSYNGVEMLARFASENQLGDFDTHLKLIGGGGVYHGVLTPACTHLIALTPEGQKYKFARQWGVHVVSLEWFLQSLKTGYRQHEADFAFKDDNSNFGAKALTRASSIATRSSSAASGVMEIPPSRSSVAEPPQARHNRPAFSRTSSRMSDKGELVFADRTDRSSIASKPLEIQFEDSSDENTGLDTWLGADCGPICQTKAAAHLLPVLVPSAEMCKALASCRIALSAASLSTDDCTEWHKKISAMSGMWISEGDLHQHTDNSTIRSTDNNQQLLCTHYVVKDTGRMGATDRNVLQALDATLASADRPLVVGSDWLRACWEAKSHAAEQPFAISWADVIADSRPGAIDAKFSDDSELHVQQHQRSKPRTRRLPVASASDVDLLPPQPRYSLNCRSLTDSAQRRSFESQRSALSLVGKPMRSCSVSDDELDPFMNDTATRKRGSFNADNCRSENQEHQGNGHEDKRQRTAPTYQPPDVTNASSHGPAFSSSPPQLELSARTNDAANDNSDLVELRIFAKCLFTSLGFSADAQLVLKRIIGENGGKYVDLTSCLPAASSSNSNLHMPLSGTDLQRAISGLAQRINSNGVTDAYLVLQLSGQGDTQLCEDIVARYCGMHVVTECWIEQCLQEGIQYPDFGQMESQPQDLPGLGRGQHVLFRPLRSDVVERMTALTLSLSISGYEGMEREHIGKLAHALGISFTEKFSRKVSHLICRPPFQGPKFERAAKWNIAVVDSFWLYQLAATGSVGEHTPATGSINAHEASLPPATPASRTHKDARVPMSLTRMSSSVAANTPLAKSSQMLLAGTPGRTPMDVSLERNFNQAIHNNARPRPTYAVTPSRHIDDDDATQLSPHHASTAHMALREPNSDAGAVDDSALARVLGGVVIGLSSRIQHRRVELTEVALQLGCRVLAHFDSKQATHLVHQSLRERDTLRECRTAAKASIAVVSPWWLYACRDAHARVPEAEFPCTFHPERHLKLVSTSPTTPSQIRAPKQPTDPVISPVANKSRGGQNSTVGSVQQANMHTSDRQQIEPESASTDIMLAIADTGAIGNMLGKKAARTYRRYRPTQNGAAVEIDLTSDDDGAINTADQLDRRPARSKDSHQSSVLSSSSSSSTNSNQASEQAAAPAHGRWWMSVGTAKTDYSTQLYSQDMQQHSRYNDLGSMPDTAAVEDALNPELATSYTASALAAANPDSVAETQTASVAPRAQTSPLAANRTTIVYGEDMDALSERDRLIQKLVGR